jgi:NAD(P)H-nitrite reductase large subunit
MEASAPLAEPTRSDEYRPMTRCECAEISFAAVARRMEEQGLTLEEACERTGCGGICTACIPDLRAHLLKAR